MESSDVHLITFGGGNFAYRRGARRVALQAQASGIFKSVTKLTDKSIPSFTPLAWSQHQNFFLNSKKGFGYWLWKPIIIEARLREIPSNEILLYIDAGCELNLLGDAARRKFDQYSRLVRQYGSLAMQMRELKEKGFFPSEQRYSKASLISAVKPSEETMTERQLLAGILFFRNDAKNHNFLQKWIELATRDNYSLLADDHGPIESDEFISHRHDQSIFSLLYKESGGYYIPDETDWKPDWRILGADYPIWAMRNRTGISMGVMKVPDLIDRFAYWARGLRQTICYKLKSMW
jgi:hypothetical protein